MPIEIRSAKRFLKHLDSLWRIELQFHQSDSAFSVNWIEMLTKCISLSHWWKWKMVCIKTVLFHITRHGRGIKSESYVRFSSVWPSSWLIVCPSVCPYTSLCLLSETDVRSVWVDDCALMSESRFPFIKKKWNFSEWEWFIYGIERVIPMLVLFSSWLLPS